MVCNHNVGVHLIYYCISWAKQIFRKDKLYFFHIYIHNIHCEHGRNSHVCKHHKTQCAWCRSIDAAQLLRNNIGLVFVFFFTVSSLSYISVILRDFIQTISESIWPTSKHGWPTVSFLKTSESPVAGITWIATTRLRLLFDLT